jgi:hypothetical protein
MALDAATFSAVSISVIPSGMSNNSSGTIPMGLATIVTMLVYVAVPLSSGFLYFTEVLFWIDVALALLSSFGVPLFMYSPRMSLISGSFRMNNQSTS